MTDREHHHAVVDGKIRHLSVSAIEKFDPRSGGCPRKWHLRYVGGHKEASDASRDAGIRLHAEIAEYLRTGVPALSALAMSGMHMIPEPGPDLLVEQSIGGPEAPFLTAAGIALRGFIDCAHDRGTNKGGEDVEATRDPPGTIELIDWKWKRDGRRVEYMLEPAELVKSVQMAGYGVFASRAFPSASTIRLSHGYFPATRGRPRKVTRLHVVDDCARTWEYVEGLARSMRHVAAERDPNRVDANTNACGAYGGCPYRGTLCHADQHRTMAGLFGEAASDEVAMGLLQNLPPVLAPQAPAPVNAQQLTAEEQALRSQMQVLQAPQAPPPIADFPSAWGAIERAGRGFPALGGPAASARALMLGVTLNAGAALAGAGDLGALMIVDPLHVVQLGQELQARAPQQQPAPMPAMQFQQLPAQPPMAPAQVAAALPHLTTSILAPDAPASNPVLAARPLEPVVQLPPVVAASTMGPLVATNASPTMPAPEPRKRRSRKVSDAAPALASPAVTPTIAAGATQGAGAGGGLEVFVDCVPSAEYESLHPYVDALCDVLSDKYNPGGLRDVRCAPKDSPLGFGGWRGAVRAIAIERPPADGSYFLDTRGNEIAAEVADALRVVCERTSGLYVRGIR